LNSIKRKFLISAIFGYLVIINYICLSIKSWILFPLTFSPVNNWLSDLGSLLLNPLASIYYRLASIISGFLLILFYLFITGLINDNRKKIRIYTVIVKIFGIMGGFFFLMTGIFPINDHSMHSLFSILLYISLGTSVAFSGVIWLYKKETRPLTVFAFFATAINISSGSFGKIFFLEWATVFFLIVYVIIVCTRSLIILNKE
jgi:hypothetical protein